MIKFVAPCVALLMPYVGVGMICCVNVATGVDLGSGVDACALSLLGTR